MATWIFSSLKYIDVDDTEKKKYSVTKGDILFNRTNSKELVGKTALVTTSEELIIAGYLVRLRVNPELANPYYVWRHLNSRWAKMTLQSMCKNIIGMANINAQEVQKMLILKAPLQRQNDFADRIEAIEKQRAMVQSNMKKSEELFQSLLQKAFKGELIKE